jgi:phosphatidylethanolamine-binding protein (PEBP) family uncharacterized protein
VHVLVVDPDAPGHTVAHWNVNGLAARTTSLARDASVRGATWKPPCPPAGDAHDHRCTVYAANAMGDAIAYGRVVALRSR